MALVTIIHHPNILIWLILTLVVIIAWLVRGIVIRNGKIREHELKTKWYNLQVQQTQIDRHFLFNILGNTQRIILSSQDLRLASENLQIATDVYRSVSSPSMLHKLSEELELIKRYVELMQSMYGRFEFALVVDPRVDLKMLFPKTLIQVFVDNSIRHGIAPLLNTRDDTFVRLSVLWSDGQAVIHISDNGVGLEAQRSKFSKTGKFSQGLELAEGMLSYANDEFNSCWLLDIQTSVNQGTDVVITIKNSRP